jgi:hypothetical protein
MGEGLYHDPDGVTAYAEPYEHAAPDDHDDDDDDWGFVWEDFITHVLAVLPASWSPLAWAWKNRARILARNGLHVLTVFEDSYNRAHLTIAVRADLEASREALAKAQLRAASARFFDALHLTYPLRVRTSPWTSAAYTPGHERMVA